MTNPYDPPPDHTLVETVKFHRPVIKFLSYAMFGSIASILVGIVGRQVLLWESIWPPVMTQLVVTSIGFFHAFKAESGGKLMLGTFLIWFPHPISAGAAAYVTATGMEENQFQFGEENVHVWWAATASAIAIGWITTQCYLRTSQFRREETIGVPFFIASWAAQWVLFTVIRYFR